MHFAQKHCEPIRVCCCSFLFSKRLLFQNPFNLLALNNSVAIKARVSKLLPTFRATTCNIPCIPFCEEGYNIVTYVLTNSFMYPRLNYSVRRTRALFHDEHGPKKIKHNSGCITDSESARGPDLEALNCIQFISSRIDNRYLNVTSFPSVVSLDDFARGDDSRRNVKNQQRN